MNKSANMVGLEKAARKSIDEGVTVMLPPKDGWKPGDRLTEEEEDYIIRQYANTMVSNAVKDAKKDALKRMRKEEDDLPAPIKWGVGIGGTLGGLAGGLGPMLALGDAYGFNRPSLGLGTAGLLGGSLLGGWLGSKFSD